MNTDRVEGVEPRHGVPLYGPDSFPALRRAGELAARALDMVGEAVEPGVTTATLDALCETFIRDHGATPAPLGYRGFPKATCTSVNHVVCHGIPSGQRLGDGDIVNIDVTVILDGWYGDSSRMYFAGAPSPRARRLCTITYDALEVGIATVRPGATLGDLGHAIQAFVEKAGLSVVRDYCGHGIGRVFHDAPSILHYGEPGMGLRLEPGMVFTIEPMVNQGGPEVRLLNDGWTVITRDRQLSAQFEHMVAVTETGCEVFTRSPRGLDHPPW
ncbi:type I methionyl aminopeptidase [Marinivivus vitaminiproducens]|uniref:type I methionyl aminopeptidase n=1 Tax=Marinivivus vitaminiproducens TaxID=3035935 RepID=UPI00279D7985|nr:type I methionyl aminopeptidase [Geminicoccaceae bacterium SCSIO 64248]